MFQWLSQQGRLTQRCARGIYQVLLMRSRDPVFYEGCGVPDTFEGRFEVLALHVGLVVDRLCRPEMGRQGSLLAQALFDAMFKNLDWGMREMGVGDLGVPKRIKKLMKAFKGRTYAYGEAARVSAGDGQLGAMLDALNRNMYADIAVDAAVRAQMAQYAVSCAQDIARLSYPDFMKGDVALSEFTLNTVKDFPIHESQEHTYAA